LHPTLFHLGPIPIRSYGFMIMIGFLVAVHLAGRRARKVGADEEFVLNLGLLALVVGIIGARAFFVIHRLPQFLAQPNPVLAMLNIIGGGLEFYGGFLSAVVAVIIYLRLKKKSIRWYLDILAPSIMLGLAFGRIGCLLNGCCWGGVTSLPMAIRFPYFSLPFQHQVFETQQLAVPGEFLVASPDRSPDLFHGEILEMTDEEFQAELETAKPDTPLGAIYGRHHGHLERYGVTLADLRELIERMDLRSLPVHPTQLYSSLNAVFISVILGMYFWRRKRHGMVVAWMFVIYPISRFLLEMVRTDNAQDTFGLTVSQGVSVAVIPLALLLMWVLHRLPEVSPRAKAEMEAHAAKQARPVEGK